MIGNLSAKKNKSARLEAPKNRARKMSLTKPVTLLSKVSKEIINVDKANFILVFV